MRAESSEPASRARNWCAVDQSRIVRENAQISTSQFGAFKEASLGPHLAPYSNNGRQLSHGAHKRAKDKGKGVA